MPYSIRTVSVYIEVSEREKEKRRKNGVRPQNEKRVKVVVIVEVIERKTN